MRATKVCIVYFFFYFLCVCACGVGGAGVCFLLAFFISFLFRCITTVRIGTARRWVGGISDAQVPSI